MTTAKALNGLMQNIANIASMLNLTANKLDLSIKCALATDFAVEFIR